MSKIKTALNEVNAAIEAAYELERSREASIAITHLETAELWLIKLQVYEEEQEQEEVKQEEVKREV